MKDDLGSDLAQDPGTANGAVQEDGIEIVDGRGAGVTAIEAMTRSGTEEGILVLSMITSPDVAGIVTISLLGTCDTNVAGMITGENHEDGTETLDGTGTTEVTGTIVTSIETIKVTETELGTFASETITRLGEEGIVTISEDGTEATAVADTTTGKDHDDGTVMVITGTGVTTGGTR